MRVKTGRRLRLIVCLSGILGGLGHAMLAIGIYDRTTSNVDTYIAAAMAITNFVVSLSFLGQHSIHIYTRIKGPVMSLFIAGILGNLLGVAGLLLNEDANFGTEMTNHLLFINCRPQDYAFAVLFYLSTYLSCVYAAGLATYFLIPANSFFDFEAQTPVGRSVHRVDPDAQLGANRTEQPMIFDPKRRPRNQPVDTVRRTMEASSTGPNNGEVSQQDAISYQSAQSEQSEDTLSTETLVGDEQQPTQHQQKRTVVFTDDVRSSNMSSTRHMESADTQPLPMSCSGDDTVEIHDSGMPESLSGSSRDQRYASALGKPVQSSTPLRTRLPSSPHVAHVPPPPPPPPPPILQLDSPTKPARRHPVFEPGKATSGAKVRSHTRNFTFQDLPASCMLPPGVAKPPVATKPKAGIPTSLLSEVQSFDRSRFAKSPRRPSCAAVSPERTAQRSTTCDAGAASTTTDHSTQTSDPGKLQLKSDTKRL